jgi:hypothetical protein
LAERTFSAIFLVIAPLKKPRTLCDCHPVACINSAIVAPCGRRSIDNTKAFLVPSALAGIGWPFLPRFLIPAFPADSSPLGATGGLCGAAVSFRRAAGYLAGFRRWLLSGVAGTAGSSAGVLGCGLTPSLVGRGLPATIPAGQLMSTVIFTNRGRLFAGAAGLLDSGIARTLGWAPLPMSLPPSSSR